MTAAAPTPKPMGLSAAESSRGYHRVTTWDACARRYGFRYGLRLEAQRGADAPARGSLLHLALMHHYRALGGFDAEDPIEAMRCAPARIAHQYDSALDVWARYVAWAEVEDGEWNVLDVEREYAVRLGGRRITARVDLVVEDAGRVIAVDHKSAGGKLQYVPREWENSGQMALLATIGAAVFPGMYGIPFGGVWVNAISTSGEAPVGLRARLQIEDAWRLSVLAGLASRLRELDLIESTPGWGTEAGVFGLDVSPEACRDRWGRCDYYDVCRAGPKALRSAHLPFDRGTDVVTELREATGL